MFIQNRKGTRQAFIIDAEAYGTLRDQKGGAITLAILSALVLGVGTASLRAHIHDSASWFLIGAGVALAIISLNLTYGHAVTARNLYSGKYRGASATPDSPSWRLMMSEHTLERIQEHEPTRLRVAAYFADHRSVDVDYGAKNLGSDPISIKLHLESWRQLIEFAREEARHAELDIDANIIEEYKLLERASQGYVGLADSIIAERRHHEDRLITDLALAEEERRNAATS